MIYVGSPSGKDVIAVLDLRERLVPEAPHIPARRSHVTEWVLGVLGAGGVAVGAWMYLVPDEWVLGGLVSVWYLSALIAGGVALAVASAVLAWKTYDSQRRWTLSLVSILVVGLAVLGGVVTLVVSLID